MPDYEDHARTPLARRRVAAAHHAAEPPARERARLPGLGAHRRARGPSRARATSRGAGQDLHPERGRFPGRLVRIARAEGDARHRRRHRRQRRPALARHRLHPAAPHHGQRGRQARAVGLRARRHGRALERHRRHRRAAAARRSAPARRSSASWCATGACAAWCSKAARRSKPATVASNLDPHVTFLCLVGESELDPDFTGAIRRFRTEGTSAKINLALDGLPEFRALPGAPGPQHRATMHICPSIDYIERAWDDAKYGRPSERPLLELTIPTMYDPSLAPAGQAHHGDLPPVRAVHAAGPYLGRAARALRRARARPDRGIRAEHPLDRSGAPGAHAARHGAHATASPAATSSTAR